MRLNRLCFACLLVCLVSTSNVLAQGRDTKGEKPLRISQGQAVDINLFLVKGRITIFDFTSEYCPPCRAYSDPLYELHRQSVNLAVVRVDINRPEIHQIDWESPVTKQYGLNSLPFFMVYDAKGKKVAEGAEAKKMVDRWLTTVE